MNNHYLYVGCTKVDLARFILNTESIARMILGGSWKDEVDFSEFSC